jgi:hypothetical protein
MAVSINNTHPSRVSTRETHETHASKLVVKEMRAVAKASKVPPPPREMQLPILNHISELLRRQKTFAIETMGKKVMGILKERMDEHIKQFQWLTRNMVKHEKNLLRERYYPFGY